MDMTKALVKQASPEEEALFEAPTVYFDEDFGTDWTTTASWASNGAGIGRSNLDADTTRFGCSDGNRGNDYYKSGLNMSGDIYVE